MKVDMTSHTQGGLPEPPPPIPTLPEPSSTVTTKSEPDSQSLAALKDIAFGSVAGIIGKIVEFPFDTVKVRLQSQPDHLPLRYNGPIDCFRQSLRDGGVRGLYRGVSAPLVGAGMETACLFWSYRVAQNVLLSTGIRKGEGGLGLGGLVTAGAMSGGLTSVILTPIELVKCRMQVPLQSPLDPNLGPRTGMSNTRPMGAVSVIADVWRREGISGFWRGQMGTFLRETGGTAAWFGAYEASSLFFKKRLLPASTADTSSSDIELPLHQQMASGALAGMSYNFIFYPADTIKSKIQTGELSHATGGQKQTFWNVGQALWRSHGLKGLYRGCGITVARSAPSSALIFTIVERLKSAFG